MGNQQILEKIKEILCDEAIIDDVSEACLESDFRKDFGLDSLDMINFLTIFEDEFSIEIDDSVLAEIITVNDAVEKIAEKLKEGEQ